MNLFFKAISKSLLFIKFTIKIDFSNLPRYWSKETIWTYMLMLYPEWIAESSQIWLRDSHVLPKLLSYEEYCRRSRCWAHRRLIAYLGCKCCQSFSYLLRHQWRKERGAVLLFCPGHHTRPLTIYYTKHSRENNQHQIVFNFHRYFIRIL
jgi:hypothetical protein